MAYIELDLMTDPDALTQVGIEYLETVIPGFEARPGNIETVLLEANAQIAAEIVEQVSPVDPLIFAGIGELIDVVPEQATPATGTATITFAAEATLLYPAGSLIAVPGPTGDPIVFATDDDALAPEGGGDVEVGVTALEDGTAGNDCFGESEPIDVVEGVETIVVSNTSGGADDEESDDYLSRLSEAMPLVAPRPILPEDFAAMARQLPGVGHAFALDLYQPASSEGGAGTPRTGSTEVDVPRCVTVVVTDESGGDPGDPILTSVFEYLDARREVNFLVYTIPPFPQPIDVAVEVERFAGYTDDEVEAAVLAEITAWLDPMTIFNDPSGEWVGDDYVRTSELIERAGRPESVRWVFNAQLGEGGVLLSPIDIGVPMMGRQAVPTLGDVDITVTSAAA